MFKSTSPCDEEKNEEEASACFKTFDLLLHLFLLEIYLLQNSLFTSNNISHSNCYVRELSLWKPAFPLRWVFCFFGLSLPSPPMLLLYTFNFLNIVKKSVLQVTFSQQNSCSIE